MARYGISYYGLSTYGAESPVSYAVNNIQAKPVTYGAIKLTWDSPSGNWFSLYIIYGIAYWSETHTGFLWMRQTVPN